MDKITPKMNIYRKRFLYFSISLAFSLILVLTALEWKSYPDIQPVELQELSTFEQFQQEIENQFIPPAPPEPATDPEFELILDVENP